MKYNNVIDTLRCWCADMNKVYSDQYHEERSNTGQSLRFFQYLVTDELQYKLGTLVDRDFSDFQELLTEIIRLMPVHLNTSLAKKLNHEEANLVRAVEDAFSEYLATVTPDCPHPTFPYVRNIIGAEADTMIARFRSVWNYDPVKYWYPLDGTADDSKLFILFDYVQPHLEEISQLIDIPKNHIFEYGENWYPSVPACAEVDEIIDYGGCEVAYTDQNFSWVIYFSHEDTVTFAGSIVPRIKEILALESVHWNSWE